MLKEDKKQQELIEKFMSTIEVWNDQKWANAIGGYFMVGIVFFIFLIPFQIWEMQYDSVAMLAGLYCCGIWIYMKMYNTYKDEDVVYNLYNIIKYMPIDKAQIEYYKFKKMLRFCIKYAACILTTQVLSAAFFFHEVSIIDNVLIPAAVTFVAPVLIFAIDEALQFIVLKKV